MKSIYFNNKTFVILFVSFLITHASASDPFLRIPAPEEQLKTINKTLTPLDYRLLRIMVWNVQKIPSSETLLDIAKLSRDSDLSIFQEYYLNLDFSDLINTFKSLSIEIAQSFFDIYNISSGIITLSKGSPSFSKAIQSKEREPAVRTPKMILVQEYHHPQIRNPLLVLNIHALNFVSQSEFESQIKQSMKFIRNHKGPIIYAGDFNTWNSDRLEFLNKLLSVYDLQRIPLKSTSFLQLDHIFIRGFKVNSAQTLENIASSDHYPITAELSLVTQ